MAISSGVKNFIESFPPSALYVQKLYELARAAKELAAEEPELAAPFTLIWLGFASLADRWNDQPLDPMLSGIISPPVVAAVKRGLEEPTIDAFNDLARTLNWAYGHALISGEVE